MLVFLLWVAAVLNYLDRQVIFSLFPPLQTELRLSNVELGLLGTVFLWIYGLLSPFGGYLADRFSRRGIIVGSLVIWSAVTWATGLARNFTELLWARGLLGVSEACYLPAALALITQHHGRTRSRAVGLHQSGLAVGTVVAGVGGGWIAEHYGWRSVFTMLGAAGLAYAIFLAAGLLRDNERPAAETEYRPRLGPALRELLGTGNFVALCSINAIASIAFWIVYAWLPLHLYERFGMSLAEAGFTATFYLQATSLAGVLAGGWLADRKPAGLCASSFPHEAQNRPKFVSVCIQICERLTVRALRCFVPTAKTARFLAFQMDEPAVLPVLYTA
jgi:MFS family permease